MARYITSNRFMYSSFPMAMEKEIQRADNLARSGKINEALRIYKKYSDNLVPDQLKCLSGAIINSVKYSISTTNIPIQSEFTCTVCEDIFLEPVTLLCGHTYCKSCEKKIKSCKNCNLSKSSIPLEVNVLIRNLIEKLYPNVLKVKKLKLEGNELFEKGLFEEALEIYREAHSLAPENATILSNRSNVYIKLNRYQDALNDAQEAIRLKPTWGKAYYRKGIALLQLQRFEEALQSFSMCAALDKSPNSLRQEISKVLHQLLLSPKKRINSRGTKRVHSCQSHSDSSDEELRSVSNAAISRFTSSTCNIEMDNILERIYNNIEKLKKTDKIAANNWVRNTEVEVEINDFECVLCCRLLLRPVTTPCGHTYCWTCIDRCLDYNHACPLCMKPLSEFLSSNQRNINDFVNNLSKVLLPNEYTARESQYEIELAAIQAERESKIPIFVCTIGFPNVTCPLYIFEPRYRLMIRRAIESGRRKFGIVDVDKSTRRFADYGTLLEITDQIYLSNGHSILSTVGLKRFKVLERGEMDGYDVAKVEYFTDEPSLNISELTRLHNRVLEKAINWFRGRVEGRSQFEVIQTYGAFPDIEPEWHLLNDGPAWAWWLLAILPLGHNLKVGILGTKNLEKRLRAIEKTLDHLMKT